MDLIVEPDPEGSPRGTAGGWRLRTPFGSWPCAIGRGGVTADKREGDGATPLGCWPLRRLLYRPDRVPDRENPPASGLPGAAIGPDDGWCDDPASPDYNRPVTRPFADSHEKLWREDRLYDLLVVLGHNDDPPVPGAGSAIFLHVARPDYSPTEGCVALDPEHLRALLPRLGPGDRLCVRESPAAD